MDTALNINCLQPGENTVFAKIKQWGAFGSGTSLVKSEFAIKNMFSEAFEHGFGEDIDYGMKLRNAGCDIIYHPNIKIEHLKVPSGGFREVMQLKKDEPGKLQPKPSPTMMLLVKKYFNKEMQRGYKMNLFLKFYKKQAIRNPLSYFKLMQKRWELSEEMSKKLEINSES